MIVKRVLAYIGLLFGLCGCTYQAQLFDPQLMEPSGGVIVKCTAIKKPIVKVSQSGDFLFWATGPGPIAAGVAHVVNETNNNRYKRMLKPALEADYFSDGFETNLRKTLEETGLQVKNIEIQYQNPGLFAVFGGAEEKPEHDYILQLKVSYGLFKSGAQCIGKIKGRLIRLADKEVIWKNKLSFEGEHGAEYKTFGDGKKAVNQWSRDESALRDRLQEVIDGAVDLLGREFAEATAEQQGQEITQFRLKSSGKVKGIIVDESQHRMIVRLKGGAVRSIPRKYVISSIER